MQRDRYKEEKERARERERNTTPAMKKKQY